MTLRASVYNAITEALARTGVFIHTDFDVTSTEPTTGAKVKIVYRHGEGYFHAQFPASTLDKAGKETRVQLTFRPGTLNLVENGTAINEYHLCEQIEQWTSRLHDDISSTPLARQMAEHQRRIDEIYATVGIGDDEKLDDDEVESLVDRIRDLETKMVANIEKSELDAREMKQRLDSLHVQVSTLCVIIQSQTTKKGAIRALVGRVLGWSAQPENNQLLKDAGKTVAGLLSDGS